MANIGTEIVIRGAEYRPCYVDGKRAIFHRWADTARSVAPRGIDESTTDDRYQYWNVGGIVEFEDGSVRRVWPSAITFADGGPGDGFAGIAWPDEDAEP